MTAVAPPPNFQSIPRNGWNAPNGAANGLSSMSVDDVSRMLIPRKGTQRSNSSSSLASSASAASTITASSAQTNGATNSANGEWASRKRPTRSIWPTSKAEPISGLSSARPQSITSATSGTSAATAMASLQAPSPMAPSPHPNIPSQTQQNGVSRTPQITENTPVLILTPMNGTFDRKTITVPFYPDVLRIGRQTNQKTQPTPQNGFFDSKVLSRQHAEVWADRQGKIWIRDVKSSNGTFVNGQRLSQENKDSDPHELRDQDMLELGIDIVSEDQKTVVHHKVAARVEHAGFYGAANNNLLDLNFGDLDPTTSAGLLSASLGQGLGQMRRTASQSSLGSNGRGPPSIAGSNISNLAHQRQSHFWLAPVNMDQIVKKLNSEYKAAKQQSLDLQRASQYIDSILAAEQQPPRKENSQKSSPIERAKGIPSLKDSLKARFSDPPAPPPQAPLPEKPDVAHRLTSSIDAPLQGFLRRSDTERPKLASANSSPVRGGSVDQTSALQIASLSEALNAAKKEMESQSLRLRRVEDLLIQERVKREDAEERAKRLEREREEKLEASNVPAVNGIHGTEGEPTNDANGEKADETSPDAPSDEITPQKLQQRLDLLMMEFNDVKAAAERWKQEKEQAERERDEERAERKSLAEIVEKLRAEEAERVARRAEKEEQRLQRKAARAREGFAGQQSLEAGEDASDDDVEVEDAAPRASKPKEAIENGYFVAPVHSKGSDQSDTLILAPRPGQFVQAAPYLSAMSVVLIGVAVMALVNKMQRGER